MIEHKKVVDLKQDPDNANLGTKRGAAMLRGNLERLGAGRSVVVDKNGVLVAGNKTAREAAEAGIEDAIIVHTDGSQLVVVQRDDLELGEVGKARELAYADNRASDVGLMWDPSQMLADIESGVDLSGVFDDDELAELMAGVLMPDGEPQEPPENASERLVELYCSDVDLGDFLTTLNAWMERESVTINIS